MTKNLTASAMNFLGKKFPTRCETPKMMGTVVGIYENIHTKSIPCNLLPACISAD